MTKEEVSKLLTDMIEQDATAIELQRVINYSMVVMDTEKQIKIRNESYERNRIDQLKEKYQGKETTT